MKAAAILSYNAHKKIAILAFFWMIQLILEAGFIPNVALSASYENSTVIIKVASQAQSIESPWEKQQVSRKQYIGTVVKKDMILVTAFAVKDAKIIEMKKIGGNKLYEMKILFVDRESNMALLGSIKPAAFKGLAPIKFGKDIATGTKAKLISVSNSSQVIVHPATLNDVGIYKSTTSSLSLLNYLFKIQKKGLGWSEPLLVDGKLVGIASGQGNDYVFAIPIFVIKHFLSDKHSKEYRGFPSVGVTIQRLAAGNLRELLKAHKHKGGVRVSDVLDTSPFKGVLQKDDVLLEVNGQKISGQGTVEDKLWKKIGFQIVINRLYGGDEVRLVFLRNGELKKAKKKINRFNSNGFVIPYFRRTQAASHLIYGGLIFQELTLDYLKAWGQNWKSSAPSRLVHIWQYGNDAIKEGSRKIVVLNRILADEFNRGYTSLDDVRIAKVNGQQVDSIAALNQVLAKPIQSGGQSFTKISLADGYGEIILGYESIDSVNERVAKNYGINSVASFFKK